MNNGADSAFVRIDIQAYTFPCACPCVGGEFLKPRTHMHRLAAGDIGRIRAAIRSAPRLSSDALITTRAGGIPLSGAPPDGLYRRNNNLRHRSPGKAGSLNPRTRAQRTGCRGLATFLPRHDTQGVSRNADGRRKISTRYVTMRNFKCA